MIRFIILLGNGNIYHGANEHESGRDCSRGGFSPHVSYDTETFEILCECDKFRLTVGAAAANDKEILHVLAKLKK